MLGIKVFTLVITDSSYMDVHCFYGEQAPLVEQMLPEIADFEKSDAFKDLLTQLRSKINCSKHGDYAALKYTDCGKEYLFHMKCHHLDEI